MRKKDEGGEIMNKVELKKKNRNVCEKDGKPMKYGIGLPEP